MDDEDLMRGVAKAMREQRAAEAECAESYEAGALDRETRERLVDSLMQTLATPSTSLIVKKPARTRARARLAGFGVVLAAAAAVLLTLRAPNTPMVLPAYESVLNGGLQTVRSQRREELPRLRRDTRLEWVLRPARPVREPIEVRTLYRGTELEVWPVASAISEQGAIRVSGRVEDLNLPEGRITLIALIAPAGALSSDPSELERQAASSDASWQVVTTTLAIER